MHLQFYTIFPIKARALQTSQAFCLDDITALYNLQFGITPAARARDDRRDSTGRVSFRLLMTLLWVLVIAGLLTGCASRPTRAALPLPGDRAAPAATAPPAPTLRPAATVTEVRPASAPTLARTLTPTARPDDACAPLPAAGEHPRYRFDVSADSAGHTLRVKMQLGLADAARLATGELAFNVPAHHTPGVFILTATRLSGSAPPLPAAFDGTTLRLRLPAGTQAAPQVTVCLEYTLALPPAASEGISAAHALGWSDLGMLAGYWHPVLAPYTPAADWRLIPYHPVGDPMVYETAEYDVTVRAPTGYTVIGAGLTEAKDGVWHFWLDRARGFAFAVSDRLIASQGDAGGVPLQVFHLPEHRVGAEATLRAVREALPLFVQTYGPYPYRELIILEAQQFGGMEYSALITFSRDWFADYQPPAAGTDFGGDMLVRFIVHELGHQWWYGVVGNDQAHEPWVDEALARYGEVLYYERLHPSHLAWWEAPSLGMATQPINQTIYSFEDTTSYVQAIYVSGTRFLLDVRKAVGAPAFAAFLQRYQRDYQDRIVTQAELLAALKELAGPALDPLLARYFKPIPSLTQVRP